jgi:hypothetical protein
MCGWLVSVVTCRSSCLLGLPACLWPASAASRQARPHCCSGQSCLLTTRRNGYGAGANQVAVMRAVNVRAAQEGASWDRAARQLERAGRRRSELAVARRARQLALCIAASSARDWLSTVADAQACSLSQGSQAAQRHPSRCAGRLAQRARRHPPRAASAGTPARPLRRSELRSARVNVSRSRLFRSLARSLARSCDGRPFSLLSRSRAAAQHDRPTGLP